MHQFYCDVLVPTLVDTLFTYNFEESVKIGQLVKVPFRRTSVYALVIAVRDVPPENINLKKGVPLPFVVSDAFIKFILRVADYNLMPLGWVWRMALGGIDIEKILKNIPWREEGYCKTNTNEKNRLDIEINEIQCREISPLFSDISHNLKELNAQQLSAARAIIHALDFSTYTSFLLDGVTGSGKTEVYFHAIAHALLQKKQCLILLPEIGLSHQWMKRFEEQFGFLPSLWHSHASPKKRLETWSKALSSVPTVFVGARSALFLPYQNLGLIIIDEEHDSSYKQEEQGTYHARDMAILRASLEKIPIVLASATPSLESLLNVEQGKSMHLCLESRFGKATLPKIHMIDRRLKNQNASVRGSHWLSVPLKQAIQQRLTLGEQSLLFLNRKGYAPMTLCRYCGYRYECPGCSAALVQHRFLKRNREVLYDKQNLAREAIVRLENCYDDVSVSQASDNKHSSMHHSCVHEEKDIAIILQCHHCGFVKPLDPSCPQCHEAGSLVPCGPAVDRVREDIEKIFPKARITCLTSDMTAKQQKDVWQTLSAHSIDIIIGTQLIAKGHHLPHLTLVGIVDADMGFHGGDLRGGEKTFQLLQQVSGRSGRDAKPGEVLVQTYQSDHPLFKALQCHDRDAFMKEERLIREQMNLPPFFRLISIVVSGVFEADVQKYAKQLASRLQSSDAVRILGPAPALMVRLKNKYRYRLLIKSTKHLNTSLWLKKILETLKIPSSLKLTIDVDPIHFT